MPSDIQSIAQTVCVGCGRGPDQAALKRLNTYSRAFGCLSCYLKYSNCGNCQHEKHGSYHAIIIPGAERAPQGKCFCGCSDYKHGLDTEFDKQFASHTGRAPTQAKCHHCGNWFDLQHGTLSLCCERCREDNRAIGG